MLMEMEKNNRTLIRAGVQQTSNAMLNFARDSSGESSDSLMIQARSHNGIVQSRKRTPVYPYRPIRTYVPCNHRTLSLRTRTYGPEHRPPRPSDTYDTLSTILAAASPRSLVKDILNPVYIKTISRTLFQRWSAYVIYPRIVQRVGVSDVCGSNAACSLAYKHVSHAPRATAGLPSRALRSGTVESEAKTRLGT